MAQALACLHRDSTTSTVDELQSKKPWYLLFADHVGVEISSPKA
jgi:hypothetical protein